MNQFEEDPAEEDYIFKPANSRHFRIGHDMVQDDERRPQPRMQRREKDIRIKDNLWRHNQLSKNGAWLKRLAPSVFPAIR